MPSKGSSRRYVESRLLRTSDEYSDEITRNGIYQEASRTNENILTKTRDISPWYCRGNAAIAAFPRQYQGDGSLVLVHWFAWLRVASRYILFWVILSADPSDVRKRLDSMYLLDDPFLGLMRI